MPSSKKWWNVDLDLSKFLQSSAVANEVCLHFFSLLTIEALKELFTAIWNLDLFFILKELVHHGEQRCERICSTCDFFQIYLFCCIPNSVLEEADDQKSTFNLSVR